jgi:hypothetical protein
MSEANYTLRLSDGTQRTWYGDPSSIFDDRVSHVVMSDSPCSFLELPSGDYVNLIHVIAIEQQ